MLESLALFFKSAAATSLIILIIGLVEPWWVLWFEATQNRLKVIKFYGIVAIVCWIVSVVINALSIHSI